MKNTKILIIGSSNTDMTVKTDKLPKPGETLLGGVFALGAGGKGANQAVAARRLGGDVTLICKVGNDLFGQNSVKHYEEEGLDVSNVLISDKPSGVALITVDADAENSIVVAPGANMDFTDEDVKKISKAVKECGILLLQLEIPIDTVLKVAKMGYEAGAMVVINPAPAAKLPEEIFKYISLFIPNETELTTFSGIEVSDEQTAISAAKAMNAKGVGKVIVTMGSKGSLLWDGKESRTIKAHKVKAVDTTAAGDTYCGALCVALSEGKTLYEAIEFATSASSLTVQKMGAQDSIPYRKDII
jgi:ribokinase